MSFWGHLVTSLSDSGKAFIESTKKDIAEFSSSLKEETKDLHLLPQAGMGEQRSRAKEGWEVKADSQGGGEESPGAGEEGTLVDGAPPKTESASSAAAGRAAAASSTSSASSLASSLGLGWGGPVSLRQLLPTFIGADSSASTSTSSGASSSAFPSSASFDPHRLSSSASPPYLRSRSTFAEEPLEPLTSAVAASYPAFAGAFRADFASTPSPYAADVAAFLRLPSVQRFHGELVEAGAVDEATFWCRLFFARHRAEEEERRREKLHSRLTSLHSQRSAQPVGADGDDLAWGDDEDEAEDSRAGQTAAAPAGMNEEAAVAAAEAAAPAAVPLASTGAGSSSAFPASSSAAAGGRSASDASAPVTAAALSALEAASPSPPSSASEGSEGSGELVDRAELLDDIRRQGGGPAEGEETDEPPAAGEGHRDREADERRRDAHPSPPSAGEDDYDEWE